MNQLKIIITCDECCESYKLCILQRNRRDSLNPLVLGRTRERKSQGKRFKKDRELKDDIN